MRWDLDPVLLRIELAIGATAGSGHPITVGPIPIDRFAQTRFPRFSRAPAQLILNQRGIDRITAIVAGPISYESNQRMRLRKRVENRPCHVNVSALVSCPNVISRTRATPFKREQDGPAVIVDVNPIPYIQTVAINRNWLVTESVSEHQRKELLGKLPGPIVVTAARNYSIEPEGMICGAHEMFGRGL